MSLTWSYEVSGQVLVVYLAGHFGADSIDRFDGALRWMLAQEPVAVVIDASGLRGWSIEGRGAVADAARLIQELGARVWLCGADELSPAAASPDTASVYADVATALAGLDRGDRPTPP